MLERHSPLAAIIRELAFLTIAPGNRYTLLRSANGVITGSGETRHRKRYATSISVLAHVINISQVNADGAREEQMKGQSQNRSDKNIARVRPRSLKLPDVAGAFLSQGDAPIRLEMRPLWTASGRHDLLYLSSYLHDAKFCREEISDAGQRLIIPLIRQRWELPKGDGEEPTFVRSELQIGPVKCFSVELAGSLFIDQEPSATFEIHGLQCSSGAFLLETSNDEEIIIDCTLARLRVRVDADCVIKLVDLPPKRKRPRKRREPLLIRLAHPMG